MTPEARWQALRRYLGERIDADAAVHKHAVEAGDVRVYAPLGGLLSANRATLAKMTELEAQR